MSKFSSMFGLRRLWHFIVPPVPDFFSLLEAQADNLQTTLKLLNDYLQECDKTHLADQVNSYVEQGHNLKDSSLHGLYTSFITPIDREDIYVLAMAIDHILDYVKNTVREVEVLQIEADVWMQQMAQELLHGAVSLRQGLKHLRAGKAEIVARTVQTREAERRIEDLYRDALQDMFQGEEYRQLAESETQPDVLTCLDFVVTRIKHREVYRHLSNAADRLAHAGEALRDISIKYDSGNK